MALACEESRWETHVALVPSRDTMRRVCFAEVESLSQVSSTWVIVVESTVS